MDKTFYHWALNSLTEHFIYLSVPCTAFLEASTVYSQVMSEDGLPYGKGVCGAAAWLRRGGSAKAPFPAAGEEQAAGVPPPSGKPGWPEDGRGSVQSPGALLLHLACLEVGRCPWLAPARWVVPWHLLLAEQRFQDIAGERLPTPRASQLGTPNLTSPWIVLLAVAQGSALC